MAGQQFIAHGAAVSFGGSDVGGILRIAIPERTRGEVEVTDESSGGDKEFIAGLRDGGSLGIVVKEIHDDVGQNAMITNYEAALGTAPGAVVITFPAASDSGSPETTISFDAFVTGIGGDDWDQAADEPATTSYTLKVAKSHTKATA